jgi:RNA polymerase sigma-70 factor (ECF subfamily)
MTITNLQHLWDHAAMAGHNQKKIDFSRQVQELTGSLYRLAYRLTRNEADAEDLVAEAITKAWSSFDKLEDQKRFRPWLFRILHNCFVDDYRKKSVRPEESPYDEEYVDYGVEEVLNILFNQSDEYLLWWANPERDFANKLLGEHISAAIDSLPEEFRVTVNLINVEGLSYDETAEVLGVPPGTVRSRMKRGRTLLQKALWMQGKESGLISSSTANIEGGKV